MRDVLAVTTVALAIALVVIPSLMGRADFRHAAGIVETQPREQATLVEVVGGYRGNDTYYAQLRGEEVDVDYGWLISNPEPGKVLEVVRDPENPTHIIAVGTPQDWVEEPSTTVAVGAIGLLFTLFAAFFAGYRLVPERAHPVFDKIIDTTGRFIRWARRTP